MNCEKIKTGNIPVESGPVELGAFVPTKILADRLILFQSGIMGGRGAGGRLRPQHGLIPTKLFLIILSKFQEFCLDLYQPSGMGRRRKRTRKSRNADDEGHLGYFYPVTPSTKQRRNNSRVLNDPKEKFGTATNINDNVGVTVIMPPGK